MFILFINLRKVTDLMFSDAQPRVKMQYFYYFLLFPSVSFYDNIENAHKNRWIEIQKDITWCQDGCIHQCKNISFYSLTSIKYSKTWESTYCLPGQVFLFFFLHFSAAVKKRLQAKRGDWFLCASKEAFLRLPLLVTGPSPTQVISSRLEYKNCFIAESGSWLLNIFSVLKLLKTVVYCSALKINDYLLLITCGCTGKLQVWECVTGA